MPIPFGAPRGGQPIPIGTRIVVIRHRTTNVALEDNVQVSAPLPAPSIIRQFWFHGNDASDAATNSTADIYLARDNDTTFNEASLGQKITDTNLRGSTPPDWVVDSRRAIHPAMSQQQGPFDIFVPIASSPAFIKTVARSNAAAFRFFEFIFVLWLLDRPWHQADQDILPRGTLEEPVCVNVCNFPEAPPPLPGPVIPGAPLPPIPTEPGLADDAFQQPLPEACPIPLEFPLQFARGTCDVP